MRDNTNIYTKSICYTICMILSIPVFIFLAFAGIIFEKDYLYFYIESLNKKFINQ